MSPSSPHRRLAGLNPGGLMAQGMATGGSDSPPELPGIEILRLLGRGGMGSVYLGTQTGLEREVAVKVVATELSGDPLFLERLEREARVMAKLRHPNLVTVHHFESLPGGSAAIVMEFVEGGTLRDRIASHPSGLPLDEALRWTREIAGALSAAHASGVVHRDMKPENVLIDGTGTARVTDFGLAVPLTPGTPRLTLTGTTVGTVDYMAPECFHDTPPDARADVYALGVMLYEMLIGRVPRGSFDPPRWVRPEVPRQLDAVTMKALRPEPAERFDSMDELLAALDARRPVGRRWFLAGAAGIAVGGGLWKALHRPEKTTALPETAPPATDGWQSLLETADLSRDRISGGWWREDAHVFSDASVCILALRDRMPPVYQVRTVFTRLSGDYCIGIFFRINGQTASVDLDGWDKDLAGVQSLDGQSLEQQPEAFTFALEDNRRYEFTVEVRPEAVRIWIDGRELGRVLIAGRTLGIIYPWAWDPAERPAALAIGSFKSPARFESVEWRPLDG